MPWTHGQAMDHLWSEGEKFRRWYDIEMLAVEAVKPGLAVAIRRITKPPTPKEVAEREKVTDHDVAAFVDCLQRQLRPDDAGWIHRGLTSSDIADTALHWTIASALQLVREVLPTTDPNRKRLAYAEKQCRVGKLSGAVGTYGNIDPDVERYVLEHLDLRPVPATQIISRDRIADAVFACEMLSRRFTWTRTAIENIPTWHERDISHSSVERLMLPDVFGHAWSVARASSCDSA